MTSLIRIDLHALSDASQSNQLLERKAQIQARKIEIKADCAKMPLRFSVRQPGFCGLTIDNKSDQKVDADEFESAEPH